MFPAITALCIYYVFSKLIQLLMKRNNCIMNDEENSTKHKGYNKGSNMKGRRNSNFSKF